MLHPYYLGPNKSSILNKSGLYDLIKKCIASILIALCEEESKISISQSNTEHLPFLQQVPTHNLNTYDSLFNL